MGAQNLKSNLKLVDQGHAPAEVAVVEQVSQPKVNPIITRMKADFSRFTQLIEKSPMDAVLILKKLHLLTKMEILKFGQCLTVNYYALSKHMMS